MDDRFTKALQVIHEQQKMKLNALQDQYGMSGMILMAQITELESILELYRKYKEEG